MTKLDPEKVGQIADAAHHQAEGIDKNDTAQKLMAGISREEQLDYAKAAQTKFNHEHAKDDHQVLNFETVAGYDGQPVLKEMTVSKQVTHKDMFSGKEEKAMQDPMVVFNNDSREAKEKPQMSQQLKGEAIKKLEEQI